MAQIKHRNQGDGDPGRKNERKKGGKERKGEQERKEGGKEILK